LNSIPIYIVKSLNTFKRESQQLINKKTLYKIKFEFDKIGNTLMLTNKKID